MNVQNRTRLFERTLTGCIAGFSVAWLSPEIPDFIRLSLPAMFAVMAWALLTAVNPWLASNFRGPAPNRRVLIQRICICIGGWIGIWLALGASRQVVFARSLHDAIFTDELSIMLLAALGITTATITLIAQVMPPLFHAARFCQRLASRKRRKAMHTVAAE